MTTSGNIAATPPQLGSAQGAGQPAGNGVKTGGGDGGLQGIFAALLNLAAGGAQAKDANGQPISIEGEISRTASASSGLGLGGLIDFEALLAGLNPADGKGDPKDPAALALGDLLAALKSALQSAEPGQPLDDANLAKANEALAAITDFLGALVAQLAPASANQAQLPPAGADQAQLVLAGANDAGAQTRITAPVLDQLLKAVELLRNFAQTNTAAPGTLPPELNTKLTELQTTLASIIAPDAGRAAAAPTPTSRANAEANNIVAMLFGSAEDSRAPDAALSRELQIHLLRGGKGEPSVDSSSSAKAVDVKNPLPDANAAQKAATATTKTAEASPPSGIAAGASGAKATDSTTSKSAQTDALISLQSQNISAQRLDGAAPRPMTAAYSPAQPNLNLPNIAFELVRQFSQGASRFEIRLDPPEMGKIDVRMDVDSSGNVRARLAVERVDTLDLLQRDARSLERALQQAGLDSSRTNLEFSLKQNPFARQDFNQGANRQFSGDELGSNSGIHGTDGENADSTSTHIYRGYASPGGVNLWV